MYNIYFGLYQYEHLLCVLILYPHPVVLETWQQPQFSVNMGIHLLLDLHTTHMSLGRISLIRRQWYRVFYCQLLDICPK